MKSSPSDSPKTVLSIASQFRQSQGEDPTLRNAWQIAPTLENQSVRHLPGSLLSNADYLSHYPSDLWPKWPLSGGSDCDRASSVDAALGFPLGTSADARGPGGTSGVSYPDPEVFELAPRDAKRLDAAGLLKPDRTGTEAATAEDEAAEDRRVNRDEEKRTPNPAANQEAAGH
ncbi:hypothetical protein NDU88_006225 [Pleurodeles waltl]|uniref:Uncharacterized protein n=1 Tax=Pleurodeles waltl TaxID=8319 RepID=A0AAV7VQX1_PLEWA|nr:hypothetical protein NDU88_006225 [Pleurodeles waltl]